MATTQTTPQAGDGEVVSPVKARQGFLDRPVLAVLTISTGLICVAFGFLYFYYLP